jgi:ornithine cyclodeaminase
MKIITAKDITRISIKNLFNKAFEYLESDLKRWQNFRKSPRHAINYKHGVIELMPCADDAIYTFKYVNGHPKNPNLGKMSITGVGMLADVKTGYPQLFCDMTVLTAIRTAATSALAAKCLADKNAKVLGLIGTGTQSEFQVYAMQQIFNIEKIRYYDRDDKAMEKFRNNLKKENIELVACKNGEEVVKGIDILTTCICEKKHVILFPYAAIKNNQKLFINAIGGDCPGKTELDPEILKNSRIVVEFFEQTKKEGEIQNLNGKIKYTELWEIIQGKKEGRTKKDKIIVFDSVGFGLEDYSMMRMLNDLQIGKEIEILPTIANPKNLFSLI